MNRRQDTSADAAPGRGLTARIGLVAGSSLGLLLADALQAVIFDVGAWDRSVYLIAIGVVGLAGLTASLMPALSASRLDPQTALRLD